MHRPDPSEYHEYYHTYVSKVPDGPILETLSDQIMASVARFSDVPEELETYAYEPGKWTVREAVGHIIDTERLFAFRAMWFARRDPAPLPGMDQDAWVSASNAGERSLSDLLDEWVGLRRSNVAMFGSFDEGAGLLRGIASEREFSVRSFAWIIAGHELHHGQLHDARYRPGIEKASGS